MDNWHTLDTEKDLKDFLEKTGWFHDGCIKEIKYKSGAYVNENLSMHPVNDKRVLNVIIQRQDRDMPMINLEFSGLRFLRLNPDDETYTCEILEGNMFFEDGCVYWCDRNITSSKQLDDYGGTAICAISCRWREISGSMGDREYYECGRQ